MTRSAQAAAEFIRGCVEQAEAGDDTTLEVRAHFRDPMRVRALFWADVVAVLVEPDRVESRGMDDEDRQQVWVIGAIPGIGEIRIVCSIDWDTRLITLNWN